MKNYRHGHSKIGEISPEYKSWGQMFQRCENEKHPRYKDYGGRGITVCERWKDFKNFYIDMGKKPINFSLERIDNEKGYSKKNCKWASMTEQIHNRRLKNKLGFPCLCRNGNKFRARIIVENKQIYSKSFETPKMAYQAYLDLTKKEKKNLCII